jgi:hypothetical protein
VIDSTGLKVYGEGAWKVRTDGLSMRRTGRKLHLWIDAGMGEIIGAAASENSVSDCQMFPEIVRLIEEEIKQISAEGSYDRRKLYPALNERKIKRAAGSAAQGSKNLATRKFSERAIARR